MRIFGGQGAKRGASAVAREGGVVMFAVDFMVALVIALLLSALFVAALGWRRPGTAGDDQAGGALLFFFVLLLATWAGGVWLTPFGPPVFGVIWLPFLVVGLLVALTLAALVPTGEERWRWPRTRGEAQAMGRTATTQREASYAAAQVAAGLGLFFWLLVVALALLVLLAYVV